MISSKMIGKRAGGVLLVGTILGAWPAVAMSQPAPVPSPTPTSPTAPSDDGAPADTLAPAPDTSGTPASANSTPPADAGPPAAPAPTQGVIRSIAVRGNERLEPATVISYSNLRPGEVYTASTLDQALMDLYATEPCKHVVSASGLTRLISSNI